MDTAPITVPALQLVPAAGPWPLEQPVQFTLPNFAFSDGAPVDEAAVRKLGAFVLRVDGAEQVWNEQAQAWQAPPNDEAGWEALTPVALSYKKPAKDGEAPWQGTWVATGLKDGSGANRYAKAAGGAPRYRLRPFALLQHAGRRHRGLGAPSAEVSFSSLEDSQRFTVAMEPKSAQDCERARFVLKNASLAEAGWVEIRTQGGRQEVEVVKCDAGGNPVSSVLLADDGNIVLRPASGGRIVIDGELEARRYTRVDAAGGRVEVT
jgi:hypothetical protein